MQEEVENRTLTLVVSGTKFTGRLFKAAIIQVHGPPQGERSWKSSAAGIPPSLPTGKQTVKQLIGQNQGVSNIEINDPSIKDFEQHRPQIRRGLCGEEGPQQPPRPST